MRKITMNEQTEKSFMEVFQEFVISQTAKGVSDTTLTNYHYHMQNIAKYLDVERAFEDITKKDIEAMAAAMRKKGLAHNSIATYFRMLKTFYNWCKDENLSSLDVPNVKEKETVKETYTDEELKLLLKRPNRGASFSEYRNWAIVNFLLNSGCRAATVQEFSFPDHVKRALYQLQMYYLHTSTRKIESLLRMKLSLFTIANIRRNMEKTIENKID